MTNKNATSNFEKCDMTIMPGGIIDFMQSIKVGKTYTPNTHVVDLFTQTKPLSYPIQLAALDRSITITNKPLSHSYDDQITKFQSKYGALLQFLKNDAFNYQQIGNTYTSLFLDQAATSLVAFCSTKCSSLRVKGDTILSLCPCVEIAILCVDDRYRYQGVGQAILRHVLHQVQQIRSIAGVQFVTLFAIPDAVSFYKKNGFEKIGSSGKVFHSPAHIRCVPMYISLPPLEVNDQAYVLS